MRSRFLAELTTNEVQEYLQNGNLAFLPAGCVEMHGPHMPIGTDTFIAQAFALRLATEADGIILPEVAYTWSGATDGFAGTISVTPELEIQLAEAVCERALRMGFRRIVIVNVHGPGQMVLQLCARRFFEKHHHPILYLDPYSALGDEAGGLFAGEAAAAKEASVVLAALSILGRGELYDQAQMAYDDVPPPPPPSRAAMRPAIAGYFMQDPRQHACPTKHISLERGMRFYDLQVRALREKLEHLDEYVEAVQREENRGWWCE